MKRKKYSNDNRLTVQLSDKQYKKVLDLSNSIGCPKVDVIRYLLSNSGKLTMKDYLRLRKKINKLNDIFNRYCLNLYRIGGNLNQAVHNQNKMINDGFYMPLKFNPKELEHQVKILTKLMNLNLLGGVIHAGN